MSEKCQDHLGGIPNVKKRLGLKLGYPGLTYPSEKYESQLGWLFHSQLFLENHSKIHGSWHHQPDYYLPLLTIINHYEPLWTIINHEIVWDICPLQKVGTGPASRFLITILCLINHWMFTPSFLIIDLVASALVHIIWTTSCLSKNRTSDNNSFGFNFATSTVFFFFKTCTMWGPQDSVQLVYNSNNYGLWYL